MHKNNDLTSLSGDALLATIAELNQRLIAVLEQKNYEDAEPLQKTLRTVFEQCIKLAESGLLSDIDEFTRLIEEFEMIRTQYESELANIKLKIVKMNKDKKALKKYSNL